MLRAFSMESTLKRKGRFPLDASNLSRTRSPMRCIWFARWSERALPDERTYEGDFGCVPIHNYTATRDCFVIGIHVRSQLRTSAYGADSSMEKPGRRDAAANWATLALLPIFPQSYCWVVGMILKIGGGENMKDPIHNRWDRSLFILFITLISTHIIQHDGFFAVASPQKRCNRKYSGGGVYVYVPCYCSNIKSTQ